MQSIKKNRQLEAEVQALRIRCEEAEETLRAIRGNEVDALVIDGPEGQQIFTLQGAEQPYRILMETMSEGALSMAADGAILYCNQRFAEMLKAPLTYVMGASIYDFVLSRDGQSLETMLRRCRREACRGEILLKTADGEEVVVSLSARSLMLGDAEAFCIVVTDLTDQKHAQAELRKAKEELEERVTQRTSELQQVNTTLCAEITERKQAEEALKKSERRERERADELAALLDAIPTPVMIAHDPECRSITGNRATDELLHLPPGGEVSLTAPADIRPRHFTAIKDGRELGMDELPAQRAARGNYVKDFDFDLVFDNGTWRHVVGYGTPLSDEFGQPRGAVHVLVDLTDRKRAEDALKKTAERLDILSDTASHLLMTEKPQQVVETVCRRVMEHLDCHAFFNFLVDAERNCLRLNAYAGIPEETAREIYFLDYGVAVCGCAARDGCRIVAENIPTTPDVRTDLVHSFGIKAYACHPLMAQGRVIGTLSFGTKSRLTFAEDELSLMKTIANQVATAMERMELLSKTEQRADELEERVQERTRELEHAYQKLLEETKEKERVEQQLRQSQKMEALGTLSGGIAHDFNNILAAIIGFSELVRDHLPEQSREVRHIERVISAGLRARDLVKQMLTFSRHTEHEMKPLRLSALVKETMKLLRASTPSSISIKVTVKSESSLILGDPIQMQQVVMNLCTNATYAMREKGGTLEVELSDFSVSPSNGNPDGIEPGLYMRLTVRDTGVGMSSETIQRIFDPFYTTKAVGEGTGLGLSVVLGIVKQTHGYITVKSELGKGSTFEVYFPKVSEEPTAEGTVIEDRIPMGHEKILFVDDEEALVEMGEDILAELGYEVTCKTSSREALALFRLDPARFDLIITDQTMPEMTGVELAEEVMTIRPDMPVILATGFSHLVDAQLAQNAGIKAFVMKPLTKKELARTVRKVLDD